MVWTDLWMDFQNGWRVEGYFCPLWVYALQRSQPSDGQGDLILWMLGGQMASTAGRKTMNFPSWKHTVHHLTTAEITAVPQRHLFRSSSSPVGTDWLQYIPSFKFECLLCPQCSTWNCSIITVIPCWLSIDQIQSLFLLMALGSVFHPSLGSRPLLTLPIEEV